MTKRWSHYKAGTFDILTDLDTNQELGQLSTTKEELSLILAAPEMLEMLIKLRDRYKPESGDTEDHKLGVELDILIDKAKGETK